MIRVAHGNRGMKARVMIRVAHGNRGMKAHVMIRVAHGNRGMKARVTIRHSLVMCGYMPAGQCCMRYMRPAFNNPPKNWYIAKI